MVPLRMPAKSFCCALARNFSSQSGQFEADPSKEMIQIVSLLFISLSILGAIYLII